MASNVNIFDKYGIKEVANVYFEALEDDLAAGVYKGDIVLFLDTLKVSTIETTAENTAAQGGWGNPKLVQWDYGKEINITLEDALLSLESLRFMLGGAIKKPKSDAPVVVRHRAVAIHRVAGDVVAAGHVPVNRIIVRTGAVGNRHGGDSARGCRRSCLVVVVHDVHFSTARTTVATVSAVVDEAVAEVHVLSLYGVFPAILLVAGVVGVSRPVVACSVEAW